MVNVVKGTFPVRFRIDGKDGTNTWLKYAETLDLTDTSSGKQYPSIMYDEPTSKCVYIGIGKGTGDEPTSGQYYQWTKYVGDDGTSFTPKGSAVTHYTSEPEYNSATKSTGYYLVDASPSALLRYWNGSATIAKDSENGDGYTTSDKHLWVKDGAKWNDLGDIQGPKGDKTYLHTISVKSYSYNGTGCKTASVQVQVEDGKSNTWGCSGSRGLTVWSISKTGTGILRYGTYDTYGDTTAADKMAAFINGSGDSYFLAITSYYGCGFSANLIAALKKYGGSDIADYTPKKQAFSFLGYRDMPEGTAQQVLNIGEDKQAAIFALVNNGICQGKGQDGRSVVSITNMYQKSSDDKNAPSSWSETSPALDNTNKFLWRRQTIKYTYGSDDVDIQVVGKIGDKGIDGTSVEYIYTRNNTGSTPSTPNTSQTDDYVPSGWYDDPQGVSSSLKYEYVSERRKKNGTWSAFSTPTLWAKWSSDGRGVKSVNTYYALTSNPKDTPADNAFSNDTLSNVVIESNSTKYVWSADKVTYTDGKSEYINKYCIGQCSELTSVTEQYAVTTTLKAPSSSDAWTNTYPTSVAKGSYIWTRDSITWRDGTTSVSTAQLTGYIPNDGGQGENGFGIVVSISRDMQYTEETLNGYFNVGHIETWFLNSESEKNGCRIGDIFMVWGRSKDKLNSHAAYFRCTDNTQTNKLVGISIRHDIVEKGDKGEDAYSYKLRSNISAIPLDNDGYPIATDSSGNKQLVLTGTIYKGSSSVTTTDGYGISVNIVHKNGTVSNTVNGVSRTIDLSKYQNITQIECTFLKGSTVLDSFTILPVKAGAAGVSYFPNMCGVWDGANVTYKWTNGSRDMVTFYVGGTPYLFAVKTAGTTIKADVHNLTPDKDSRWEKADSPFSMLFANFVYTDNASVAGFKWSDEVMQSPNGLLELNGKTGKITAKSGKIGVVDISTTGALVTPYWSISAEGRLWCAEAQITGKITATSGTFDNCTINETCKAGFMKYATNKFNGNIINCGFVDFIAGWNITGSTTLYLPSVSEGEYMKIIVSNFITTKTYFPDFTLAVEGNGTLHDLFDYPLGVYTKKTLSIGRMAYYEFTGINEQGHSRWICTNSMFT